MSRQRPEITHRWDGWTVFTVPYDRYWVDSVKDVVPVHSRDWDPVSKSWAIGPSYASWAIDLTRAVFGDVNQQGEKPHHSAPSDPFATLHLRETAPPALIDAAFRVLAKDAHPDKGGSHERMLALTAARDALREMVTS